jgi:hypothetical protein
VGVVTGVFKGVEGDGWEEVRRDVANDDDDDDDDDNEEEESR